MMEGRPDRAWMRRMLQPDGGQLVDMHRLSHHACVVHPAYACACPKEKYAMLKDDRRAGEGCVECAS